MKFLAKVLPGLKAAISSGLKKFLSDPVRKAKQITHIPARALLLFLICAMPLLGQVSISGNLRDVTGTIVTTNVQVDFELQNYGSMIPKVSGTGGLVLLKKTFKPDISGNIHCTGAGCTDTVYANSAVTPAGTFYSVCILIQGRTLRCNNYLINGAWDLSTAIPLNIIPNAGPSQLITQSFHCGVSMPATVWTCIHNFNDLDVEGTTYSTFGVRIFPDTFTATNPNTVTITWVTPQAGWATLIHAGPITLSTSQPNAVIQNAIIGQTIGGPSLSITAPTTFTQPIVGSVTGSAGSTVSVSGGGTVAESNAGVFINTQMNEYILSQINACSPLTEFQKGVGANFATEGITSCVIVPAAGATVFQVNAFSAYVEDKSTGAVPNVVGGSFIAYCAGTGSHCWAINPVGSETGTATNGVIQAIEADFGSNSPGSTATGLNVSYNPSCSQGGCSTNSTGIKISAAPAVGQQLNSAILITDKATLSPFVALQLGATNTTNGNGSQLIRFVNRTAGGATQFSTIFTDQNGNFFFTPAGTFNAFTGDLNVAGNIFPNVAGAKDLGTTSLPWGNLWLGGLNNFKFQPAALAGPRVVSIPDPSTSAGVITLKLPLFGSVGSGGIQTGRVAGCATAASLAATCTTVLTWGTSFLNTNYTVSCLGDLISSGVPLNGGLTAKANASVTFQTVSGTAAAAQYTSIDCTATAD